MQRCRIHLALALLGESFLCAGAVVLVVGGVLRRGDLDGRVGAHPGCAAAGAAATRAAGGAVALFALCCLWGLQMQVRYDAWLSM